MNDMNSFNREHKKKQLRSQMISSESSISPNRTQVIKDEEESREIVRKARWKIRRKRGLIFLIVVMLLAAAGFGIFYYIRNYQYTVSSVVWENSFQNEEERKEGAFVNYLRFGSNLIRYTRDGAAYIDNKGKNIWAVSYEMTSPVACVNGDYAAIADQKGNRIYICDKSGNQGVATTLLPIIKVTVSSHGVVAALLEDTKANYITLFRKDGTALDITIKGLLGGNVGYPVDISLSPDGTQLIGSYVYLNNGMIKSRVAFHNFSEVGKNVNNRLVAGYDEPYENSLVARVIFLSEIYSCAFADKSISFFSSKNVMSPELIHQEAVEDEIQSIFYSSEYIGVIVRPSAGGATYRMDLYRINGDRVFSREFDYLYDGAEVDGNQVILYNEDSCQLYNMSGVLKYEGSFDYAVSMITAGVLPNQLIVTGPQFMKAIKLQ